MCTRKGFPYVALWRVRAARILAAPSFLYPVVIASLVDSSVLDMMNRPLRLALTASFALIIAYSLLNFDCRPEDDSS